ncbi:MAG: hypothetical protein L0Z71_07425 [Anaerolineae bacterium]|nr:hypothetical protein [Anaerolineae bacterium]
MEEIRLLIILLIFLLALLVLNIYLARILPGGEWFYLRWSSARAFLFEQVEPYGTEVAQRVQDLIYGRNAASSEYPYVLNDPFFIVLLYAPLAVLPEFISLLIPSLSPSLNFALARGVWMLLSEIALVGIIVLSLRLSEWEPPRWLFISLIGFGLFSYFSLQSLVSNSPSIFLTFLYLSILLSLRSYSDELAGALLFLVAYQWEIGGLFFLYILILVFANKRWSVLTGFGMSLFLALVVSFLVYPGWGLSYVRAVLSDWMRGANLNLSSILSVWFPDSRFSLGTIISILLGIVVFIEWIGSTQSNFRRIIWTASLSLAATPLIGFAIFPSNHVVLILPLILILTLVWERWIRNRVLACLLVLSLAFWVPFGIYFRGIIFEDRLYSDLLSVLPPVATIIGLYWMRWWVLHSHRTWMDQIGVRK